MTDTLHDDPQAYLPDPPPDDQSWSAPNNADAEAAVLGSVLLSTAAFHEVQAEIEPGDFYQPRHEAIYDAAAHLYANGDPVDVVTVAEHLQASGQLRRIGGVPYLHTLISEVANPGAGRYYARIVAEYATRRRLAQAAASIVQLAHATTGGDPADLIRRATEVLTAATPATIDQHPVRAQDIDDYLATGDDEYAWLIPNFLERQDRFILTAAEGVGKSTLLRQWAVQAAAGIHPLTGGPIDPISVLIVDLENSARQTRRKIKPLRLAAGQRLHPTQLHIINKVDGLDLTNPEDELWLTHLVAAHKADLLITGPIYKLAGGNPNEEKEAKPAALALDRIRSTHDCAVLLEGHTAKAPAGVAPKNRPKEPFGWSGWLRWPEFGYHLAEDGTLTHWRGQRDERPIPDALNRGGAWPWTPNGPAAPGEAEVRWQQIQRTLTSYGAPMTIKELADATAIPRSTLQRVLQQYDAEYAHLISTLRLH